MADAPPPDPIGPLILEQLIHLVEEVRELRAAQQRRDLQLQRLSQKIDRFLTGELELQSTLVQVRQVVACNRDALLELKRSIEAVLDLAVGDPLHAREFGA